MASRDSERDTILVVDDEPAILETYGDYLIRPITESARVQSSRIPPPPAALPRTIHPEYELLLARSGEEAVERVRAERARGGRVQCGFFDMRMPGGLDGVETIRRVRAIDPEILVVIVTAYEDRSFEDLAPIFAGGHDDEWDYLNKPFTETEIAQKARCLVASWHRRRREERYLRELGEQNRTLEERVRERTQTLTRKAAALERALDDVRRAQRELVHGERLAAIGQLSAGLAHEINSPATYALLDVRHLIAQGAVTDPELVSVLHNVREGIQRIVDISRELGVFARRGEDLGDEVDVNQVVDRALRIVNRPVYAQADVVHRRGRPPRVRGDEGQLVQVVVTLLLNAVQALDPHRRAENVVVVTTEDREGHAVIRVADNGGGLTEEQQAHVFEPFFAARPAWNGTGLGLSVSRRIVANHRGAIAVESELRRGTSFEVVLPAAPAEELEAVLEVAAPAPSGVSLARLRLLVIDDEPQLLASYRRWLRRRYDVETAGSAAEALAVIERGERFDAVLCDVMMPDVSGIELYATLCEQWPLLATRLVFVTGGAFTEEAREALDKSGRPCLFKPFELDELEVCLTALLSVAGERAG